MGQTGYWTTNLIDVSLAAGETEIVFPLADRQMGGGRDWASRKFPYRNGQEDEDTGARPRDISYSIPLFRDVEPEHYPSTMNDLVEFFESDEVKGRATLTDPEFGPMPVRLVSYQWSTTSKERDGGRLELIFETLGDENPVVGSGAAGEADAVGDADALDTALADAGLEPKDTAEVMRDSGVAIDETERLELGLSATFSANIGLAPGVDITVPTAPALPSFTTSVVSSSGFGPTTVPDNEVRLFTALVTRFQNSIERGDLVSADEVAVEIDRLLARAAAVRTEDVLEDPETGWAVVQASSRLMASIQRVGTRAFQNTPLVVDYELTRELSAFEVAVLLFSNPSRVQEIIDLNPQLSPDFLPKGATLIVPLE